MEEISMNVLWIPIYVPMEFVKIYVVVTVVIATVAMNQMSLEETVLTLMSAWSTDCSVTMAYAETHLGVTAAHAPLGMCSGLKQRHVKI